MSFPVYSACIINSHVLNVEGRFVFCTILRQCDMFISIIPQAVHRKIIYSTFRLLKVSKLPTTSLCFKKNAAERSFCDNLTHSRPIFKVVYLLQLRTFELKYVTASVTCVTKSEFVEIGSDLAKLSRKFRSTLFIEYSDFYSIFIYFYVEIITPSIDQSINWLINQQINLSITYQAGFQSLRVSKREHSWINCQLYHNCQ